MAGLWWLWADSPPEHNAKIDQAGKWNLTLPAFRGYRARPITPDAAPPGWMHEAGSYSQVGNLMPVSVAFVERQQQATQLNLPPIGPVDDSTQRAHALQAALAASLNSLPSRKPLGK